MAQPTVPTAGAHFARLVGRDREQALLREHLAAALAGRGGLVLIGGEAGIGKTALAEALLAEAAAQGALVLVGSCYDLAETPPYGPWAELFVRAPRDDPPGLPAAVLPGEDAGEPLASQAAIFARVRAYLAALAARRPLVLLLEDLHWADVTSRDLLRALARQLGALPLLLLATYRSDELTRRHPLYTLLPTLVREARAARLDLRPLDDAAIGTLVAARYGLGGAERDRLVRYLAGRTEGNALFLGELLRTLEGEEALHRLDDGRWTVGDLEVAPVPALLQQVVAARVAGLPPETERLLGVAAVVGHEVALPVWAAAGGVTEEELLAHAERALEARLLADAPDGAGVRFAHALIREALYAETPALRRRALHRRAGEALAALPRPDPDAVAYHFQRAGDDRAVDWLAAAGERARRADALLVAAERFVAAAALLAGDASRDGRRGWLLFLGAFMVFFSDPGQALRYLDAAETLALRSGERALAAHGRFLRGLALCHHWRLRDGVSALEQGVADLEALPDDDVRRHGIEVALARLGVLPPMAGPAPAPASPFAAAHRAALANWYGWLGYYREARAVGEAILAAVAAHPARGVNPYQWGLAHASAALGQPEEAGRAYARTRAATYAQHEPYSTLYILFAELQHFLLPYHADDVSARTRLVAEEGPVLAQLSGAAMAASYPGQAGLLVALLEGRWREARQLAEAGRTAATIGHAQTAVAALGALACWQGDRELAWARVRELHPAGSATAPGGCFFIPGIALQALAVELALDAGDAATAGEWIAAHGRWLDWSGAVLWRAEHLLMHARHDRLAGDLAAARRHAAAALARAVEPRQPLALLAAHRVCGDLDTAAGQHAEAQAHLEAALALAEACAAPYERALTLLALAELRADTGNGDEARALLDEVAAICAPLDAKPARARAAALAARLAAAQPLPVPPPARGLPAGLTAREAEVLRLVAEGLTDARVAERLYISRATVNAHLRSIYGKLGVSSRAAATRRAVEHGLT
jgi:DNA-binding CsgD family transcriptional regulator